MTWFIKKKLEIEYYKLNIIFTTPSIFIDFMFYYYYNLMLFWKSYIIKYQYFFFVCCPAILYTKFHFFFPERKASSMSSIWYSSLEVSPAAVLRPLRPCKGTSNATSCVVDVVQSVTTYIIMVIFLSSAVILKRQDMFTILMGSDYCLVSNNNDTN